MKWYNFIFVLLAFIFFVGCTAPPSQTIVVSDKNQENVNTLSVQGYSEFDTAPDISEISFAIETENLDAKTAQEENRKTSNTVMQALTLVGVDKKDIETTYYNLQKIQEWDPKQRKSVDKGYRVTNTIKVTLTDLDLVGDVLDAVIKSGVNRVNDVSFRLSDKKEAEVKAEALRLAAENARVKADSLALGTDVQIKGVRSVQEEWFDQYIQRNYAMKEMVVSTEGMDEAYPSTPISPEQVHIKVGVRVVFEI